MDSFPAKQKFSANYGAISYNPEMLTENQILAAWKGMLEASKDLNEEEIETSKAIARAMNDLSDWEFFDKGKTDDQREEIRLALVDEYESMLDIVSEATTIDEKQ